MILDLAVLALLPWVMLVTGVNQGRSSKTNFLEKRNRREQENLCALGKNKKIS